MIDLESLSAADIMQSEVPIVAGEVTASEAARLMSSKSYQCLIVPPPEGSRRAHGILTAKDIVQLLGEVSPSALDEVRVQDIMSRPVISVSSSIAVVDCINLMRMTGVRRVLVTHDETPVGLLSYCDVLAKLVARVPGVLGVQSTVTYRIPEHRGFALHS